MSDRHTGDLSPAAGEPLRSALIEDPAVQAAMQPWIAMECYQLGQGNRLGRIDSLDFGRQQIVRESQLVGVQKLGVMPPDLCTVSCCTLDPSFRFSEWHAGGVDAVFFMPAHTEFDIFVPAGAQTRYVCFSQEEFLCGARTLDPARWERAPEHLTVVNAARQAELEATVDQWLGQLAAKGLSMDADPMRHRVLHQILGIVTATRPDDPPPSSRERSRAFHVCRSARSFVEDSLAQNCLPNLVDICAWVGVSERTLQYAFRAYVGLSPLAYLRLCRLNRARAVLRACDPHNTTVTQIAARFGFLHMGRFALDYRRLFDESPSVTLAA